MRILGIVATIAAVFGPRRVSADCITPSGNFANSCSNITMNRYLSIDPYVPPTCQLTALCPTMFSGLPPQSNEVFIPTELKLVDVTNNNGTLTHNGNPLSGKTIAATTTTILSNPEHCLPPQGSYHKTCNTVKKPYISTDPNLINTDLCEAKAKCATLDGTMTSNMIYFNIKTENKLLSVEKVENCNGKLKKGKRDDECQTDSNSIREIAERSCQTRLIV